MIVKSLETSKPRKLLVFLSSGTIFFATMVSSFTAHAQDGKTESATIGIENSQSIVIAMRHDVHPYVVNSGTSGLEVDIVNAVFTHTKYTPSLVQLPRVRMIQSFNSGNFDGILTSNVSLNGEGCITDWYIKHQNVGVTLSQREIAVEDITDIAKLSIITFDGATRFLGPKFAAETRKSPRYVESSDQNVHIALLYNGYFDAAIGDEWILKLAQVNQKKKSGTFRPLTIHRVLPTTFYAARFQEQTICNAFNAGLNKIRKSGLYDRIARGHYDEISAQISTYENEVASAEEPTQTKN